MAWLNDVFGGQDFWDASVNAVLTAYAWMKEWQVLLAGLLVFFSALIVARAIRRAALVRVSPPRSRVALARDKDQSDLRQEPSASPIPALSPAQPPALGPAIQPSEFIGHLEQLRSFIRSALASLTLTAEKENSPALFLCQRIAHFRVERVALPLQASKPARELHAALQEQMEGFRHTLTKDMSSAQMSEALVKLNTAARNLVAALAPAPIRQAGSEPR